MRFPERNASISLAALVVVSIFSSPGWLPDTIDSGMPISGWRRSDSKQRAAIISTFCKRFGRSPDGHRQLSGPCRDRSNIFSFGAGTSGRLFVPRRFLPSARGRLL